MNVRGWCNCPLRAISLQRQALAAELAPELAGAGNLGILPGDTSKLAEAVQLFGSSPSLRTSLGRSGRQFIVSELTRDAIAGQFKTILQRVISPATRVQS